MGMKGTANSHSPMKNTFRVYPYGGVHFVDPRVTSPLSFAHVTDLHLTPEPGDDSEKPYAFAIDWWDRTMNRPHQVLPKLLAEIRAAKVDFVFFGGDNIDCYQPKMAERLVELTAQFGLRAFFQSGNHDWENFYLRYITHEYNAELRSSTLGKLCKHWGMPAPYYSFEMKGVRFIALDPPYMNLSGRWMGKIDDQQTEWFLNQILYDGPIVVLHHIPFFSPTLEPRMRAIWNQLLCVADDQNGGRILQAIENCPNILGTFTGHTHFRSEDALGGTCQFMTAPASDGQWREVRISNVPPPKSLRAEGTPDVTLPEAMR